MFSQISIKSTTNNHKNPSKKIVIPLVPLFTFIPLFDKSLHSQWELPCDPGEVWIWIRFQSEVNSTLWSNQLKWGCNLNFEFWILNFEFWISFWGELDSLVKSVKVGLQGKSKSALHCGKTQLFCPTDWSLGGFSRFASRKRKPANFSLSGLFTSRK